MSATDHRQHRLALAYVALSALCWSLSGLFMRSIETDLMTIVCLRGLVSGIAILIVFFCIEGRKSGRILRASPGPTAAAAVLAAASMASGLGAIHYSTVAEAMVIYATAPFLTAGVAFIFIKEKASWSTILASVVACCGVLFMVMDATGGGSLLGKGLAVIMALTVAGLATVMRHYRNIQMLPAMAFASLLCSLATFWFADPFSVSAQDVGLILIFGVVQNALGLTLYVFGARHISAAAASLLTALEVPLTPLWVWLFMGETPPAGTLIGGAIVLVALFGHIVAEVKIAKPAPAPV